MHNLVVGCLVVAYLSANIYAIVKVRVLESARSPQASPSLWCPLPTVGLSYSVGMQTYGDHAPI